MIDTEKIMDDLNLLVKELNSASDPMIHSNYTLDTGEKRKDFLSVSVVVTRNTGGSPESDYIVQDNVDIEAEKDGTICASFYKEMYICKTKKWHINHLKDWKGVLHSLREFFIGD